MSYPSLASPSTQLNMKLSSTKHSSTIMLKFPETMLTTRTLPHVTTYLEKNLPTIFLSTCYNPDNLLFSEEVKKTEIAHLFEHILLEYLVLMTAEKTIKPYRGVTMWDWRKYPKGTFHVRINVGTKDALLLAVAIDKAYMLLRDIIDSSEQANN